MIAAVERVGLSAFPVKACAGGKAQYHPRLMLALLIYAYANGIFSSRRMERASHRDIGVRFVAAHLHPDHGRPRSPGARRWPRSSTPPVPGWRPRPARKRKPPDPTPPPERQSPLTDPDSALMRIHPGKAAGVRVDEGFHC